MEQYPEGEMRNKHQRQEGTGGESQLAYSMGKTPEVESRTWLPDASRQG
jgi:hypothetical protein